MSSSSEKPGLQAAQKDLRGKARDKSTSGGVLSPYVGARRLSATKPMRLFQRPASLNVSKTPKMGIEPCSIYSISHNKKWRGSMKKGFFLSALVFVICVATGFC